MNYWYVYIMINKPNGVIYIGVTDNIEERVKEHKLKVYPISFPAKYNCDKLVYFDEIEQGNEAEKRERQLKKWKRDLKTELIEEMHTNWNLNYNKLRK